MTNQNRCWTKNNTFYEQNFLNFCFHFHYKELEVHGKILCILITLEKYATRFHFELKRVLTSMETLYRDIVTYFTCRKIASLLSWQHKLCFTRMLAWESAKTIAVYHYIPCILFFHRSTRACLQRKFAHVLTRQPLNKKSIQIKF